MMKVLIACALLVFAAILAADDLFPGLTFKDTAPGSLAFASYAPYGVTLANSSGVVHGQFVITGDTSYLSVDTLNLISPVATAPRNPVPAGFVIVQINGAPAKIPFYH